MAGKSYAVISAMFYWSYRATLLWCGDDLARAQIPGGGITGSRLGGWLPGSQTDPGVPGDTGGQDAALTGGFVLQTCLWVQPPGSSREANLATCPGSWPVILFV